MCGWRVLAEERLNHQGWSQPGSVFPRRSKKKQANSEEGIPGSENRKMQSEVVRKVLNSCYWKVYEVRIRSGVRA